MKNSRLKELRLAVFVIVQLIPCAVTAQTVNEQIWAEYMLNYPFANSYNVELSATYSTTTSQPKWRAFDLQVTPEYSITPNVDLMGSFFLGNTFQNQALNTLEIREMLGARFHFTPNRRILLRALLRFEQRNLQNRETYEWDHSTRTRLRLETITPLNKPTMFAGDKLWYMILDGEYFVIMDQDVQERFANRFRLRFGPGYRINYGLRLEFLYTLQRSKNTIDDEFSTTDNIFRFRLKQYLHKSKPTAVQGVGN